MSNQSSDIVHRIVEAAEKYYAGVPVMSDEEFDHLVDQLPEDYPLRVTPGWGHSVYGDKVALPRDRQMTLSKVHDIEDYPHDIEYYVSPKVDGLTLFLWIDDGVVVRAATRGDGVHGQDVSPRFLRAMMNKYDTLDTGTSFTGIIRGELYVPKSVFSEFLVDEYATPRHAASGIINSKSPTGYEHHLHFAQHPYQKRCLCRIIPEVPTFTMHRDCIPDKQRYKNIAGDFPTDGLVFAADGVEPRAFKFETTVATAVVTSVDWRLSPRGRWIPVAQIEPTPLYGTMNSQANAYNYEYVQNERIGPGCVIEFTKANEIIPYIVRVIKPTEEQPFQPPAPFYVDGVHAMSNSDKESLMVQEFARNYFCIHGWASVGKILEYLEVHTFDHLDSVVTNVLAGEMSELARGTRAKAYNLRDAEIFTRLCSKLDDRPEEDIIYNQYFMSTLGIDGIGPSNAEKIDIDKLKEAISIYRQTPTVDTFSQYVSYIDSLPVNSRVRDRLLDEDIIKALNSLLNSNTFMRMKYLKDDEPEGDVTICITGSLSKSKSAYARDLQAANVVVSGGLSSEVNYLVVPSLEWSSNKVADAKHRGIEIITEDQMVRMWLS